MHEFQVVVTDVEFGGTRFYGWCTLGDWSATEHRGDGLARLMDGWRVAHGMSELVDWALEDQWFGEDSLDEWSGGEGEG